MYALFVADCLYVRLKGLAACVLHGPGINADMQRAN